MGIKQLYNDNLRKLTNEYGDVSVIQTISCRYVDAMNHCQCRSGKTHILLKICLVVKFLYINLFVLLVLLPIRWLTYTAKGSNSN